MRKIGIFLLLMAFWGSMVLATPVIPVASCACFDGDYYVDCPCNDPHENCLGEGESITTLFIDPPYLTTTTTQKPKYPVTYRMGAGININKHGVGPQLMFEGQRKGFGIQFTFGIQKVQDVNCVNGLFCSALHGSPAIPYSTHGDTRTPIPVPPPFLPQVKLVTEQDSFGLIMFTFPLK